MKITDCHVHNIPGMRPLDLLEAMDREGLDRIVLFSPHPYANPRCGKEQLGGPRAAPLLSSELRLRFLTESIEDVEKSDGRIIPFAWIDPTAPDCLEHVDRAVDMGYRGIKIIPNGWYPGEERFFPFYERIQNHELPILAHTGILYSYGTNSDCCRPVNFEFLCGFPRLNFIFAHMGWPWVLECIGTVGSIRSADAKTNAKRKIGLNPTGLKHPLIPPGALESVISMAGMSSLLFGTDSYVDRIKAQDQVESDDKVLESLGVSSSDRAGFFHKNLDKWI